MFVCIPLLVFWLMGISLGTPLRNARDRFHARRPRSPPGLDRQAALAAKAAMRRKFQNAPAILAGLGRSSGYTIPTSLQIAYDRASDFATNITLLNSLAKSSLRQPFNTSTIRVAATLGSNFTLEPLQDQTDGVNDFEYYGPMAFGSQGQPLLIDFDTGSADLWIPVNCHDCGELSAFDANASSTYRATDQLFYVAYGSGAVTGTVAQDTVSLGPLQVQNQTMGAVRSVSSNFAIAPNDGLAGLAFSTIATSHAPTFFENLIPQLEAPLFSVYLTRGIVSGSEIYFGGIDVSKASEDTVSWVPVVSKTYWTVSMTAASVNGKPIDTVTEHFSTIIDTGTSFIYGPTHFVDAIYQQIPGSTPAFDFGLGFYAYPCNATIAVTLTLGPHALALDPRDFNLGGHAGDPSGRTCVGAIVDGGPTFRLVILGDSFLKGYVSIFDYAHGARVGFLKRLHT